MREAASRRSAAAEVAERSPEWRRLLTFRFYRDLVREVVKDDLLNLAASLAYYAMLALFPFALFLVSLAAYAPVPDLYAQVMAYLRPVVPGDAMGLIDGFLRPVLSDRQPQLLTLSIAGALWVASTGFHTLADVLNRVYGVPEQRPWWRVRLIGLVMALALPLLVLGASLLMIVGPRLGGRLAGWLHLGAAFEVGWNLLRVPVALAVMVFVMAVVYFVLPAARMRWRWISPGSAIAVPLWVGVSHGFSLYVTNFGNYSATYGSLGAVVVLLVWLYLSALVVLLGAEINELCEPRGAAHRRREIGAPAATPPLRPDGTRAPEMEPA